MDYYVNKPIVIFGSNGTIIDCGILTESQCSQVGSCSASETFPSTVGNASEEETFAKDQPSKALLNKMNPWMLLGSAFIVFLGICETRGDA